MIGKQIYQILSTSTGITKYVSTNIYPVIAPQNVSGAYIVYSVTGGINYTKDGVASGEASVKIDVLNTDYFEGLVIANAIFQLMSGKSNYSDTEVTFKNIKLLDFDEDIFNENVYVQKQIYSISFV